MPNNPLTQAELTAYTSTFPYPQIPAGYFFASPPTGAGPLAYRLFDASYISIGIINPNRLGTGSTGAGNLYLADNGTWKSITIATPTLAQVTTAGNTTTNAITVGGITAATNLFYTDTVNSRVGIGTSSPGAKVDINLGTGNLGNSVYVRNSSSTGYSSVTMFDNRNVTSYVGQWGLYGSGVASPNTSNMFFYNSAGGGVGFYVGTGVSPANDLKLLIHSTGNILIGTTTDSGYKLDVNGTFRSNALWTTSAGVVQWGPPPSAYGVLTWDTGYARIHATTGNRLDLGAGGGLHMSISTAGNVGIGTTSPSEKLDVQGPIRLSSAINQSLNGFSRIYTSYNLAKGETYIEPEGSTTPTRFFPNGGVVIGTTTQQPPANGLLVTGNIGVGTVAPAYKVDVQGTTLAASSVSVQGAFNINPLTAPPAIGGFTLSAGTNLGVGTYYYMVVYVTALGETSAGANLTVVTTTGNTTVNLTGIPVSSDPRVTARKLYRTKLGGTADNHWFLATISNNVTTTYTDSIADASLTGVGLQYYKVNTTARYFTVSGTQGMIIDQNLTALGRSAGNAIITSNATAVRTVLIGANAGQNITTGTSNVIVGVAGGNVTTGSDNSLFGDLAGYNLTIGYGNTIVGAQAGRFLNSGYQNIFIGQGAGSYLTNGSTQVTTAFQNIAIGRNTRLSTINDSNSIIIGDTALGLGSNTTVIGNSSTTFTSIPAGNMTIGGTTNAGYKLDVTGTARIQSNLTVASLTTDGPVVSNSGVLNSVAGYTGMVTIQQPTPLPPVTFDIQNGIIVNVL